MTVPINVKNLLDFCHESGHKFYPSIIYLVTKVLNQMENFRMFRDAEGNLCVWDQVVPNYTIFHEDDKTFSDCWTGYSDDFETFYREITEDMEKGYKKSDHGNTADAAGADAVHRPGDHGSVRNPHGGIHGDRDLREKRG